MTTLETTTAAIASDAQVIAPAPKKSRKAKASGDFVLVKASAPKAKKGTKAKAEKGTKAKAKAEKGTKAPKEKAPKEKKVSAVSTIRALIAANFDITINEIEDELKACGLEKSRSTIETIRSDALCTIRALKDAGRL